MTPDAVFWERIADMPALEAEQELVARRVEILAENVELARHNTVQGDAAGRRMLENSAQLAALNERIKYLRKMQHAISWRAAVAAVYGDDGVERCSVWMAQQRQRWTPDGTG